MPLQERLSPFMHLARPGATPMAMECDALCGAGKLQDLKAQFSLSFLHERVGASHEWTADSLRKNMECPYDRKSVESGQSVSVRVDLGGRRILKKTQQRLQNS